MKVTSNEWTEFFEVVRANNRAHAGHFSWATDRAVAELGVLKEFEIALERRGEAFFSLSRHRGEGNDPPDCEATALDGGRVGIELTELVDGDAAAKARRREWYEPKDWHLDLVPKLDALIRRKDAPHLKGAAYSQYVLLIHTDEPGLELGSVRQTLATHVFPKTHLISRAYLLISYDAWERSYPCIRLNFERAA